MYRLGVMFKNVVEVLRRRLHADNVNISKAIAEEEVGIGRETDIEANRSRRPISSTCIHFATSVICYEI